MLEVNFDGMVGPTHQYAGLSIGNLASTRHRGAIGNPKAAAQEGLEKMRQLMELGVPQAVLPPQPRPQASALRRIGFSGTDSQVLEQALANAPDLLAACSSASSMWAANAATVAPSRDTEDGRLHITVANLCTLFHRSLEAPQTLATLSAIFADPSRFFVHEPLPATSELSDEGAANHIRLEAGEEVLHLFGYGRRAKAVQHVLQFPARQTLEASQAVARLNQLPKARTLFWQQHPEGIDQGAFHSDVLAVAHRHYFLFHEAAFLDPDALEEVLAAHFGGALVLRRVAHAELSVEEAVESYLFNSQIVTVPSGEMVLVAPEEVRSVEKAARLVDSLLDEQGPLSRVVFAKVNASMKNGGGPACLRLRVGLTTTEQNHLNGRMLLTPDLCRKLAQWVDTHYRDRLTLADLTAPTFLRETETALDELTQLLELGSIYGFQLT